MKGEKALHKDLIKTSIDITEPGRLRNSLKSRFYDKMACRYYYLSNICRLRYDDCLLQLTLEFDITPTTIIKHLTKRLGMVTEMVENQVSPSELKKRYPWYDWSGSLTPPKV